MSVANGTRILLLNALISLLIYCSIPLCGKNLYSQDKIQNIIGQSKFRTHLSVILPEGIYES